MTNFKNILIAPDSFKESLTALEVAEAIEIGFSKVFPDANYIKLPMADGGEGTVQSIVDATGGEIKKVEVTDPLNKKIKAQYGISGNGKQAIIEMASASGLEKVSKAQRNPMITTSKGLGDLIQAALTHDVDEIIIGLGGSATNDGGAGMIQSLGGELLDQYGKQIPAGGKNLHKIQTINVSKLNPRLKKVKIKVAYDVNNPLLGKDGASYVYGPQKGATSQQVEKLEENLTYFAQKLQQKFGKNIIDVPGAGAAGGVGAGLSAFTDAELQSGGDLIANLLRLEEKVKQADLVVTGEGEINQQTFYGKAPIVVANIAQKYKVPTIAIAGSISAGYEVVYEKGIDAVFSALPKITSLEEALIEGQNNIILTAHNIARLLKVTLKI